MQITPVDHYNNLFLITDIVPQDLCDAIVATPWLDLPWQKEMGQETWARRKILNRSIAWADQWDKHIMSIWNDIGKAIGRDLGFCYGTAWWLDEPGFTCAMHTDGELWGAMQIIWIAASEHHGTGFYHNKNGTEPRQQFMSVPNSGYIMVNFPRPNGYVHLHWHAMLNPVPAGTFRLSSYTLLRPNEQC